MPVPEGERPFSFACTRCGHCCSGASGYVWVEEEEVEGLARALGMEPEAFASAHLRQVPDPSSGALRLSLREEGRESGRCSLLEGTNVCRAYTARPRHCREFPYWPSVLSDPEAFERARSVCPGIVAPVDEATRARAFERLSALYAELEETIARSQPVCTQRGLCCRFEEAGHELYATALEADYAAHLHPTAPPPEGEGRCPHHQGGLCRAREGRPLGCRTYYCDTRTEDALRDVHEDTLRRLRRIEEECGYPPSYGRFPGMLKARGIGEQRTGEDA